MWWSMSVTQEPPPVPGTPAPCAKAPGLYVESPVSCAATPVPRAESKGELVSVDVVRRAGSTTPQATHILAELPYLPSAVPRARQVLRESLRGAGLDEDATAVAELLVSELVTNAVKYGQPPVWLLVELRPGLVHASVSDTSTALPERRVVDDDSEGGRGLLVLDALAGSWGAVTADHGKYLWFDLVVTPAPATQPDPPNPIRTRPASRPPEPRP
jgi:anti-sigma regulatory factor (Ser/Thr protein kinase)